MLVSTRCLQVPGPFCLLGTYLFHSVVIGSILYIDHRWTSLRCNLYASEWFFEAKFRSSCQQSSEKVVQARTHEQVPGSVAFVRTACIAGLGYKRWQSEGWL